MTLLTLHAVTTGHGAKALLRDLELNIDAGELVAIIGPNGAGKSTLLKTIANDLRPLTGEICLQGTPLAQLPAGDRARRVAVLPQHSSLSFAFSAAEVVALGRIPHASGLAEDQRIVACALQALDIAHLHDRFYPQLSGGEKQRVQLARVLAQIWPCEQQSLSRLLLLDEPTAHIDLGHQQQLMHEITRFARTGAGVLMVLHDINLAIQFADRLVALAEGGILAEGPPEDILDQPLINRLFGDQLRVTELPGSRRPVVLPLPAQPAEAQ